MFESMISKCEGMSAAAFNSLDQLDREALRRWYVNAKRFVKPKDEKQALKDVKKVCSMYKLYGSEQVALVNPVGNKLNLSVQSREAAERRQDRQFGKLVSNAKENWSKMSKMSAMQSKDASVSKISADHSDNFSLEGRSVLKHDDRFYLKLHAKGTKKALGKPFF